MYYLTSVPEIKEAVKQRRKKRSIVQAMVNKHIEDKFGIVDFSELVAQQIFASRSAFGSITSPPYGFDQDASYGVLARQIPSLSAEDIACYLLAHRLDLAPFALAFARDAFHSNSNDKLFRVRIPFVSWSKKKNLVLNHKMVVTNTNGSSLTNLDMTILDRMQVGDMKLNDYHCQLQQSFYSHDKAPYIYGDISRAWGEILAQTKEAKKLAPIVWKRGDDGKDILWDREYTVEEARALVVRPSAKWYYPMYLSMFMDGRFILLESYDSEVVPKARQLFETAMDDIYKATGFMPLIVKTYTLRTDMLYVNQHIIDEPNKACAELSIARHWTDDTVAMSRWFADQAIQFGRV